MILFLILNLFAECDIVVEKAELIKIKEMYLDSTDTYKIDGVFYIDDAEYYEAEIKYKKTWDNEIQDFRRAAFATMGGKEYVCEVEYYPNSLKDFEDIIKDCVCNHNWFYYLLEKVYKNTHWGQPIPSYHM
jgi:hypothetical protein